MKCIDFTGKNGLFRYPCGAVFHLTPLFALSCLLSAFLMLSASVVVAVEVPSLYQGTVLVSSREDERERNRAFSNALRQVLLKVTGNNDVYTAPLIRRALANADDYVDTWSYRSVTGSGDEQTSGNDGVELSVRFFEPQVLQLLEEAGIPLWPSNRPYTLVWMVVQDELGDRTLIDSGANEFADILALLESESEKRALPLLFPILDFEDRQAVSLQDAWNLEAERLLAASERYQSESVLAVRLFRTLGGDVFGKSVYLFRDQVFELEVVEEALSGFIEESVALAADELSAYYAVLLSGTDSRMEVNLSVQGVQSAEDYAGLLTYLGGLTGVNDFQIVTVNQEVIELKLSTGGQLRQLVESIALNRSLLPAGDLVREDNQVFMRYQWNR